MASFDHIISFRLNVIMNNRTLPPLFFSLVIFVAHFSGNFAYSWNCADLTKVQLFQLLELCPQDIPRPERQAYKDFYKDWGTTSGVVGWTITKMVHLWLVVSIG